MMKRIFKTTATLLLIFSFIFTTGFSDARDRIVEIEQSAINMANGYYVECENLYETTRFVKANLIANSYKNIDTVVIGSSHMLPIVNHNNSKTFLNLAIGGANLQERLNVLGLLFLNEIKYKEVVFEIDVYSLYEESRVMKSKYKFFNDFGNYYLDIMMGNYKTLKPNLDINKNYAEKKSEYSETDIVTSYDKTSYPKNKYCYNNEASLLFPDYFSPPDKQHLLEINAVTSSMIQNHYIANLDFDNLYRDRHLDQNSMAILDAMMKNFKANDIFVTMVIVPRDVYIYDNFNEQSMKIYQEVEYYANELAHKYGFKIEGSFNPHRYNLTEDDYFDGYHMFPDKLNSLFTIN